MHHSRPFHFPVAGGRGGGGGGEKGTTRFLGILWWRSWWKGKPTRHLGISSNPRTR